MHVIADIDRNLLFFVFMSSSGIWMTNNKAAILHDALNLAKRPYNMDRSTRLCRTADQAVGRRRPVGELDDDRLMIDHIVIATPYTAPIGIIRSQRFQLLFKARLHTQMLYTVPDVISP